MADLAIGAQAPAFALTDADGGTLRLKDFKGRKLVVYFYPKDDTPGCTKEAMAFSEARAAFAAADTDIVGISMDTAARHAKFRDKYGLAVSLAADPERQAIDAYGVWVEKSLYGRSYMGIERATFLIDRNGSIAGIWRKVKVPGHAEAVLKAAIALG
jgi:peroxiredoxin Q/BCP